MNEVDAHPPNAAAEIYARLGQCYGPGALRELLPSVNPAQGEGLSAGDADAANDDGRAAGGNGWASDDPAVADHLILAALFVLLREGGGGCRVSFALPELLRLLGLPVADSSWEFVERALGWLMHPVRCEFDVVPPPGGCGRASRVTSWRRLIAGYEYSEESGRGDCGQAAGLAGRLVTVTFNPDLLPGPGTTRTTS